MCRNPYTTADGKAYGCGQCLPCRINHRRIWKHRILLEASQNKDNAFVTLTYSDDSLPLSDTGVPTLKRRDLKLFLMLLNTRLKRLAGPFPKSFRYFAVGEYGDETKRPHYHAVLFGLPTCAYGRTRVDRHSKGRGCCVACDLVRDVWGKGFVYLGEVEADSAEYVAQYVTKKMTKADDPRLGDRYPEFKVQSLRPGIAKDAMWEIASIMLQHFEDRLDVPDVLRHSKSTPPLPLGRYLRQNLRKMVGRSEKAPQEVVDKMVDELSELFQAAKAFRGEARQVVFKNALLDASENDAARQAFRMKLRRKRRVI